MNRLKQAADNALRDLTVSPALREAVWNRIREEEASAAPRKGRKWVAVLLAAVLSLLAAFPAAAAVSPTANNWLFALSPSLAERLYPVNRTVTENGIALTVHYAANDDRRAMIFLTLCDTQKKNRLAADTDLMDSYSLKGAGSHIACTSELLEYDSDTQTAVYCLSLAGHKRLSGKMTVLSLLRFMSGKTVQEYYNTGFACGAYATEKEAATTLQKIKNRGAVGYDQVLSDDTPLLETDQTEIAIPGFEPAVISNIGYLDGKLHIQTRWSASFDNHGSLCLVKKGANAMDEDNTIEPAGVQYRTAEDEAASDGSVYQKHIEYIFPVSPQELAQYDLWAEYTLDGTVTEGEWEVNFRLEQAESRELTVPASLASSATVSTLGLDVGGSRAGTEALAEVQLTGGDTIAVKPLLVDKSLSQLLSDSSDFSYTFPAPIDLNDIQTITLDGTCIYQKDANSASSGTTSER